MAFEGCTAGRKEGVVGMGRACRGAERPGVQERVTEGGKLGSPREREAAAHTHTYMHMDRTQINSPTEHSARVRSKILGQ